MRKAIDLLMAKHAVIVVVVTIVLLDILLTVRLFLPKLLDVIVRLHLFEIVVLMSMVQLLLLSSRLLEPTIVVISSEDEAQATVRSLLGKDHAITTVQVISAGLSSRARFLRELIELPRHLTVEIVACFGPGSPNPDALDRNELGPASYQTIIHYEVTDSPDARVRLWNSKNTPSFRGILLSDAHGPKYAILGWYTYSKANTRIAGRRNAQILADRTSENGYRLLRFAEKEWEHRTSPGEADQLFPTPGEAAPTPVVS